MNKNKLASVIYKLHNYIHITKEYQITFKIHIKILDNYISQPIFNAI